MTTYLYSPVNFAIGLSYWLAGRTDMTYSAAYQELTDTTPRWPYKLLLFCILMVVSLMVAFGAATVILSVPHFMDGLNIHMLLSFVAIALLIGSTWWVAQGLTRARRFYIQMCILGASVRNRA